MEFNENSYSLSQLFQCHYYAIDLHSVEWLPSKMGSKWIVLTFKQSIIPSMLFKMKPILATSLIFPRHGFCETQSFLLFESKCCQYFKWEPWTDAAASASCKDNKPALYLREAYSDKQFQAQRGGQIAAEWLKAELTDTFGASPSCEQEDLLKKLDYLMQTLTTMPKTAAPLIDLVSVPYTEAGKTVLIWVDLQHPWKTGN